MDLLETVRHLKELGIEVGLKRKVSIPEREQRTHANAACIICPGRKPLHQRKCEMGYTEKFQQGRPNSFNVYGYRWDGERFIVEPEEAKIVRLIFDNFLKGLSAERTEVQLEEMGVKSYTGGHFSNTSIRAILRNEKYTGNMLLQKVFIPDHISQVRIMMANSHTEDSHEAIISLRLMKGAGNRTAQRVGVFANKSINTTRFTSKVSAEIAVSATGVVRQRKDSNGLLCLICQTKMQEFKRMILKLSEMLRG